MKRFFFISVILLTISLVFTVARFDEQDLIQRLENPNASQDTTEHIIGRIDLVRNFEGLVKELKDISEQHHITIQFIRYDHEYNFKQFIYAVFPSDKEINHLPLSKKISKKSFYNLQAPLTNKFTLFKNRLAIPLSQNKKFLLPIDAAEEHIYSCRVDVYTTQEKREKIESAFLRLQHADYMAVEFPDSPPPPASLWNQWITTLSFHPETVFLFISSIFLFAFTCFLNASKRQGSEKNQGLTFPFILLERIKSLFIPMFILQMVVYTITNYINMGVFYLKSIYHMRFLLLFFYLLLFLILLMIEGFKYMQPFSKTRHQVESYIAFFLVYLLKILLTALLLFYLLQTHHDIHALRQINHSFRSVQTSYEKLMKIDIDNSQWILNYPKRDQLYNFLQNLDNSNLLITQYVDLGYVVQIYGNTAFFRFAGFKTEEMDEVVTSTNYVYLSSYYKEKNTEALTAVHDQYNGNPPEIRFLADRPYVPVIESFFDQYHLRSMYTKKYYLCSHKDYVGKLNFYVEESKMSELLMKIKPFCDENRIQLKISRLSDIVTESILGRQEILKYSLSFTIGIAVSMIIMLISLLYYIYTHVKNKFAVKMLHGISNWSVLIYLIISFLLVDILSGYLLHHFSFLFETRGVTPTLDLVFTGRKIFLFTFFLMAIDVMGVIAINFWINKNIISELKEGA